LGNKRDKITVNTVSFEMIISNLVENAIKFNDKWLIKISVITERVERESKSRQ
jgi:signal transduction histidine kinase